MTNGSLLKYFVAIGIGGLALLFMDAFFEIHTPGTDVFLFKEAGVNLATQGRLVAAYLPHMDFGEEKPFAYYPPVYPFVFGVWTWLVGVGLKQSICFNGFLTLLRTLLMVVLVAPAISQEFWSPSFRWKRRGSGILFLILTVLSTDRDRPDELALVFGLLLMVVLFSRKRMGLKVTAAALCLALTGATSPACGLFFGLVTLCWALGQAGGLRKLCAIAGGSLLAWALMVAPLFLQDRALGDRFSQQLGFSSFPYLRFWNPSWTFHDYQSWFLRFWSLFVEEGQEYLWLSVTLSIPALWFATRRILKRESFPSGSLFLVAPLLFYLGAPLVWTLQPYYLWFPSIVLMITILQWQHRTNQHALGTVIILFAVIPLLQFEARGALNAFQKPMREHADPMQQEVLPFIEPESTVAVTHDQYFTFREKRVTFNAAYWLQDSDKFDYLYLTNLNNSRQLAMKPEQLIPKGHVACFSLVKDFSSHQPIRWLGKNTGYYVRGSGGQLYKNRCKNTKAS